MEWLEHAVLAELPEHWTTEVDTSGDEVVLLVQHDVLGGHQFRWPEAPEDPLLGADEVLERLRELGLLTASQRMPELTALEVEMFREAHAVIAAANLSHRQAQSVIGLTASLGHVSEEAGRWALASLELLAPWYRYPPDPASTDG